MTSTVPALRQMTPADLPRVLELERLLFPEDAWSEEMYRDELAGANRYYIVAEDGAGSVVGWAGLASTVGPADVLTIGVVPEREGEGIGTRLLSALLDEAAARGCPEVFLDVRADNERAQRLYARFGFERIGVRRGYYQPSGVDAIVMRKG